MNKKNILLALALPALLLSSCGEEKKGNASSSDVTQDSNLVYGEVDANGWANAFALDNNFTASSLATRDGGFSRVLTCLTSSAMRMSQYSSTAKGGEDTLVSEIFATKEGENNVEYDYVPEYQLYAKKTLQRESPYAKFSSSLIEIFKSSYSSFSYDAEKQGYFASSLSSELNGQSYLSKDVLIRFSSGKLIDIDFDACDNLTKAVVSHGYISEFGSTTITLPDSSKIKSGLLTGEEAWGEAFISLEEGKNATIKTVPSEGEGGASKTSAFSSNAVHLTSTSSKEGKTISNDVYYSVEGENTYVYAKDETGLYAKKLCDGSVNAYEELAALSSFFATSYGLFTYDKSKDAYVAPSIALPMESGMSYSNVVASFSNGRLSSLAYDYSDSKVSVSEIGTTVVDLPSNDKIYPEGKVDEAKWKAAFEKACNTLNFTYVYSSLSSEDSYSLSLKNKYLCDGNSIEYQYEQIYEATDDEPMISTLHNYYSLENGTWYEYSSADDEASWNKSESTADTFASIKEEASLFSNSYSSFQFDEMSSSYKADSISIDNVAYTEVVISFKGNQLAGIEYKSEDYSHVFSSFGETQVSLPRIA